jgi:hypothetical protein
MRFFTELVVVGADSPHPSEDLFCPSFWSSDEFDSDGDFYYDGIDGRWTVLELRRTPAGVRGSSLEVYTFREQRFYEPGHGGVAVLARTLEDVRSGAYADDDRIAALAQVAVTSLSIETGSVEDYREYLETVAMFLEHSAGVTVGRFRLDATGFREAFLQDEG